MGKSRSNKPKDEETKNEKIQELKSLVRRLQKENKELKKEVGKLRAKEIAAEDKIWQEGEVASAQPEENKVDNPCPKCEHEMSTVQIVKFLVYLCKNCGYRCKERAES